MLIVLSQSLVNKLGIIVLSAFLLSKSTFFKRYILKKKLTLRDKILFSDMGIDPDGPTFMEVVEDGIKIYRNKPQAYNKKRLEDLKVRSKVS
jgi:hypothetical protein